MNSCTINGIVITAVSLTFWCIADVLVQQPAVIHVVHAVQVLMH